MELDEGMELEEEGMKLQEEWRHVQASLAKR